MMPNAPYFCHLWAWRFYAFPTEISTEILKACANKLTLPFKIGCKALSVTYGDSSPRGRAKGCRQLSILIRSVICFTATHKGGGFFAFAFHSCGKGRVLSPCFCTPLSVTCGDSAPKGRNIQTISPSASCRGAFIYFSLDQMMIIISAGMPSRYTGHTLYPKGRMVRWMVAISDHISSEMIR